MKFKKMRYYLTSGVILFKSIKNIYSLINLFFNKKALITFRNGFSFEIQTMLDVLIIKETIIDDCYQIKKCFGNKKPKIIVDIGAGFGDFSIMAASLYKEAYIYAFEPHPVLYGLLINNIKRSGLTNLKAYPYAVGNKDYLDLNVLAEHTQTSAFNKDTSSTFRVKSVGFNTIAPESKIDFLKMDCEGGEYEIIKSLTPTQKKRIMHISMEYHNLYIPHVDRFIKASLTPYFQIHRVDDPYDEGYGLLFAQNKKSRSAPIRSI